jgi:hypothetical protein
VFFFLSFVYVREMRDIKEWGGARPFKGKWADYVVLV